MTAYRPIVLSGLWLVSVAALVTAEAPWTFVPPDPVGTGTDFFYGVDGTTSNDVWAVGVSDAPDRRALIEHFDGTSWTQLPTPDTGVPGPFETLWNVVAVSSEQAVAVGSYTPVGSTAQPLAMEWNGSAWELISTPQFSGGADFRAVDAPSGGQVWVAGFRFGQAFIGRRNGGGWDIEFAPPVSTYRNRFYAMHARTDDEIWLVGTRGEGLGDFKILLQRYDGNASWTTFDVPTPGWMDSLTGVHAFAADDAWAVGYYYHTTLFLTQPLIMHFDGQSWSKVELPPFTEGSAEFRGMTATAPDDIHAAGTYATADGTPRPFIMHYDGAGWSEVSLPPTGGLGEWFRGMGTSSDGTVWAVGQYYDGVSTEPMAFHTDTDEAVAVGEPSPAHATPIVASPNPFRAGTSLQIGNPGSGPVRARIWDASGRLVRTLVSGDRSAGSRSLHWDGRDAEGGAVPGGIYLVEVSTADRVDRGKVVRLR